jgi:uncharacterized membrane protein
VTRPADTVDAPAPVLPSRADPTAWRAVQRIGGAWGLHAGTRSWWTPLRWVLAMTLFTLLLGVGEKADCVRSDWTGFQPYTHVCQSDIPATWTDADLDSGAVPYRDTNLPYPVVTGAMIFLGADITRGLHALHDNWSELLLYVAVSALLLAICALVVAGCTAQTARGRPYDAAIFALSPLLVFHAFTAWDLLAMAFASGALLGWARNRPVLAGALIGLGAAAKLYPVLLLLPIWILAARTKRTAEATWATFAAGLTWCAVNGPLAFAYHGGWWHYYRASVDSETTRTSLWGIIKTAVSGSVSDRDQVSWVPSSVAVAMTVTAALLAVAWVGLRVPTRPRLAQLAFLCVLAYLLTSKHWQPSESLWLLPLLALARPRWRLTMLWQFSEIAMWVMVMLVELGASDVKGTRGFGVSYGWLIVMVFVRDILLLVLAALVVQEMWHPELDVVRLGGADDPGGGVFDGAPDYWAEADDDASDLRKNSMSAP